MVDYKRNAIHNFDIDTAILLLGFYFKKRILALFWKIDF